MKNIYIIIVFILWCQFAHGQILVVKDNLTHEPLEFAAVFSEKPLISTLTDAKGRANISGFENTESISIQMLGYKTSVFSYNDLKEMNFKVLLTQEDFTLNEVVISAIRWESEKSIVPSKISTLKASEIQTSNPQTSADLLSNAQGVFVQKSQLGGGSPMIRGFAANRVLLCVDGVRMNNAIFRGGNLQNVISVDPLIVDKAEVIYGPGSIIYGSDAIGGTMCFYTPEVIVSKSNKFLTKGSAFARWSSANNEKTIHADLNVGFQKLSFLTSISYSDFGDLRMGSKGPEENYLRTEYAQRINGKDSVVQNSDPLIQVSTGYTQKNFLQKIRFKASEKVNISYGLYYSETSDYSRYDRLTRYKKGKLASAEWYYGPQKWLMNSLNASIKQNTLLSDKINVTVAFQKFEESRHDRNFGKDMKYNRVENVDLLTVNCDVNKNISEKSNLYYGIELLLNKVNSTGTDEDITTGETILGPGRYPDGSTWNSYSAYLTNRYKLGTDISIQGGVRFNEVMMAAQFDTAFYSFPFTDMNIQTGAITGNAGIVWNPNEKLTSFLNLSTGFRAPNIDDAGKIFDSEPGYVVVPNPKLKSEYAWNAEAGVTKVVLTYLKISGNVYYTLLNNALVRRDYTMDGNDSIIYDGEMSRIQAIQNAAKAYVYGAEGAIEAKLPSGFGALVNLCYQKGTEELDDGSSSPLRHAAPWFGSAHLTYRNGILLIDAFTRYCGEVSYANMSSTETSKDYLYAVDLNGNPYSPAWYTLNLTAQYRFGETFLLTGGIENILDSRYRPYSSGIVAPGRNFIISIKAIF